MQHKMKLLCAALIVAPTFAPSFAFSAEVHPDVAAALNYSLPVNSCEKPQLPGVSKDVVDPATGAVNRADLDSYTLGRYKRAEKRWMKCLTKYKKGLMKDFESLKGSASHGLTQTQAKAIMANMKSIQAAVESPTGLPTRPNS